MLRINAKNTSDTGYIYAYFKSKIGQKILLSSIYGAVIQHLEPEHLSKVIIPDAPENQRRQIHELIVKSYELRDESNALIDEAAKILIDELSLPPIEDFETKKNFTVKLSNLRGRLDASFHVPIVDKIISHIKNHAAEVTTIGDKRISSAVILPGRFKRIYVDEGHGRIFIGGKQRVYVEKEFGYSFLGGREITQLNPEVEKFLSKKVHHERYENELKVAENMILVTDRGTIGKVALVPKHWENYAVSQNVLKIIPADNIAGYLYIYLNSEI